MKRIYLAITKKNENGGKCAYAESFTTNENLLAVMERIPKEAIDLCRANIKYISEHAELMTVDELREFVHADYEQATAA